RRLETPPALLLRLRFGTVWCLAVAALRGGGALSLGRSEGPAPRLGARFRIAFETRRLAGAPRVLAGSAAALPWGGGAAAPGWALAVPWRALHLAVSDLVWLCGQG